MTCQSAGLTKRAVPLLGVFVPKHRGRKDKQSVGASNSEVTGSQMTFAPLLGSQCSPSAETAEHPAMKRPRIRSRAALRYHQAAATEYSSKAKNN